MRPTLLAFALAFATGCPGGSGTCFSHNLFPSPRASAAVTDAGVVVDVAWGPTEAPASFYASPAVTGRAQLLDAGATGAQVLSTGSTDPTFTLRYVEGPIRCPHVGMDDTYVLSVSAPRPSDGGASAGTVTFDLELGAL